MARREDDGSLVIGVYGLWGEGKTSLLNLIASDLKNYGDVVVVKFNPWYFRSEEALIQGFFSQVAQALGKSLPSMAKKFGGLLQEFGTYLSLASASIYGVVTVSPGEPIKSLGTRLSKNTLEELRKRIEILLQQAQRCVVILVDDIDRLDRAEIQATLKLVKLSAGLRRVAYILAMDDQHVAESLGEKYGAGSIESGRQFLEKIVQVPLRLPPADPLSLRTLAFDGVNEALRVSGVDLSQEDARRFVNLFVRGYDSRMTTPRQAKRYGNALLFALPLLKDEVNALDFLLIEGIRVFYPQLHETIRSRPELFVGRPADRSRTQEEQGRTTEEIRKALVGISDDATRGVREILEFLFPRSGTTAYGPDWDSIWASNRRICSEDYFERYFAYTVSRRDISDLKLDRFLQQLPSHSAERAISAFSQMVSREAAARVIRKLRLREDTVDPGAIQNLCVSIAHAGELFPREQGPFAFLATVAQAAILVSKLVRRLAPGAGRAELAERVVEIARPLSFAAEIFGWLRSGTEDPLEKRILSVDAERVVGAKLAARIRLAAQSKPILEEERERIPSLMWIWAEYSDRPQEAQSYLTEQFARNPGRVATLLLSFTGTAWSMTDGLPARADFRREAYNSVAKLIAPEIVLQHLKAVFGAEIENAEYHDGGDRPVEEAVARQFAFLHRQASVEKPGKDRVPGEEPRPSLDQIVGDGGPEKPAQLE